VDGILKPKGETESAISRMFEKIGQRPNRRVFVPEKPSEFDATGRRIVEEQLKPFSLDMLRLIQKLQRGNSLYINST